MFFIYAFIKVETTKEEKDKEEEHITKKKMARKMAPMILFSSR